MSCLFNHSYQVGSRGFEQLGSNKRKVRYLVIYCTKCGEVHSHIFIDNEPNKLASK